MPERLILEAAIDRAGWNDNSVIEVLLAYIEAQKSPDAFRDHVNQRADDEVDLAYGCQTTLDFDPED